MLLLLAVAVVAHMPRMSIKQPSDIDDMAVVRKRLSVPRRPTVEPDTVTVQQRAESTEQPASTRTGAYDVHMTRAHHDS